VPDPDEPAHNDDGRHGHEDPYEKIDHPDPPHREPTALAESGSGSRP
jgi:hypothetical protein